MGIESSNLRVVRVGGSLLTWDNLVPRLRKWLDEQKPVATTVFIAGGGPWIELLRQASARFSIGEEDAHVLCVRGLTTTANLLGELIHAPVLVSINDLKQAVGGEVVLDVFHQLEIVDRAKQDALPRTWGVTSDSIAARLARDLEAKELVLLKSAECPLDDTGDREKLSSLGYVDEYFPTASRGLTVRYVNLRSQ